MTGKSPKKKTRDKEEKPDAGAEGLLAELEETRALADSNLEMAKRIQAEFENYKKRSARENEEFRRFANSALIAGLLDTVDDLDRALAQVSEETEFVKGIGKVREGLMKTLSEYGLEEIPTDAGFDPAVHEAMTTVDGDEDGKIVQVYQKGYTMEGRVLRYAKVVVTRKTEEKEEEEKGE